MFELTEDQKNLQHTVREWARSELAPIAYELDQKAEFPTELYLKMNKDIGVCAIPFKEEHGGLGLGILEMSLAIEELARADQTFALSVMVAVATGLTLQTFGSDLHKQEFLPGIVAGTAVGSIAGTEPQAGSWTAGFTTRADKQGDKWSISGEKAFITNSGTDITAYNLVGAVTSPKDAEKTKMSLFLVPAGTPGEPMLDRCHEIAFGAPLGRRCSTALTDSRFHGLYNKTPSYVYGAIAENVHGFDERVNLPSVRRVTAAMALFIVDWCGLEKI